jgi:hypothetical protein
VRAALYRPVQPPHGDRIACELNSFPVFAAPEQYPISGCNNGECQPGVPITAATIANGTAINATAGASSQQASYQDNAFYDMRYGLEHWPLFNLGGGNLPLNWTNGTGHVINPDTGIRNVRSDSLVRWMAYSAIAFGAKGLNYYCENTHNIS